MLTSLAGGFSLPSLWVQGGCAGANNAAALPRVPISGLCDGENHISGPAYSASAFFQAMWSMTTLKNGANSLGLHPILGLKGEEIA